MSWGVARGYGCGGTARWVDTRCVADEPGS